MVNNNVQSLIISIQKVVKSTMLSFTYQITSLPILLLTYRILIYIQKNLIKKNQQTKSSWPPVRMYFPSCVQQTHKSAPKYDEQAKTCTSCLILTTRKIPFRET